MNPTRPLVCLALALAAAGSARAQLRLDWTRFHATATSDGASAVAVDDAGNVYAAGTSGSDWSYTEGSGFVTAWDASGAQLWSTTFEAGLGHGEFPSAIELDGAGGVYVAGIANGIPFAQYAAFLLHVDATGAVTWLVDRPLTTNGHWTPVLAVDAQGHAILGGRAPSGTGDFSIASFSPSGALDWEVTHAGSAGATDQIASLALAPNGEIVAVGTAAANTASASPFLMRIASDGTLLQALELVTPEITEGACSDVAVATDGRIYVAGTSLAPGAPQFALALFAFDAQGVLLWTRALGTAFNNSGALAVALDPFGRAILLGNRSQGAFGSGTALMLAAFEADGTRAWQVVENDIAGGPSSNIWNHGNHLLLDADGEAIVTGSHGPMLADTASNAMAFAVDAAGQTRFGLDYDFQPGPTASFDHGFAAAGVRGHAIVIAGRAQTTPTSTGFDGFVMRLTRTALGFCYGDGSAGACPCGNVSAPVERAGCASSLGRGARLADRGASSLAHDSFALVGTAMPDALVLYFQSSAAQAASAFGDGLSCTGGTLVRVGAALNAAGTSQVPAAGDPALSTHVGAPGERIYQAVYRDPATYCSGATSNTTNALRVTWTP